MKIIQYMNRLNPLYMDCIKKGVIDRLPVGVDYSLLQNDPYSCVCRNDDPRTPSEELRIRLAIDNPDMFWMDTDTAIRSWPSLEKKGKPYFIHSQSMADESAVEEFIFYANGCPDFFRELLEEYLKDQTRTDNVWLSEYVHRRRADVFVIPTVHFIHCRFSVVHRAPPDWTEISGDGYSVKNIGGSPSLFLNF